MMVTDYRLCVGQKLDSLMVFQWRNCSECWSKLGPNPLPWGVKGRGEQ
jgi:hypothetical protein